MKGLATHAVASGQVAPTVPSSSERIKRLWRDTGAFSDEKDRGNLMRWQGRVAHDRNLRCGQAEKLGDGAEIGVLRRGPILGFGPMSQQAHRDPRPRDPTNPIHTSPPECS